MRKNSGLTQDELAALAGLKRGDWISHFETGQRKPNFDHLIALAKALKTPIDHLVGLFP
jgi:transcriptional regulator with XRE-family HTH domain